MKHTHILYVHGREWVVPVSRSSSSNSTAGEGSSGIAVDLTVSISTKAFVITFLRYLKHNNIVRLTCAGSICLCSMLISPSKVSYLFQKGHSFLALFGSHFCYHSNGKSQINTRLLHLCSSNKAIRRNG